MIAVADYGGVMLRLHWQKADLNFFLYELGDPTFQALVLSMNRWHGTPVLLEPNIRTARLSAPHEKEINDAN